MGTTAFLFTSLKGGCGTSTVCANVAAALAKHNKRVLLLSFNRYCTSVDMILGMDSAFVLDVTDFPESRMEDICLPVAGFDSLYLALRLPFSDKDMCFSEKGFLTEAVNSALFDYILIDKTEGTPDEIAELSSIANMTVIVSTQMNDSVRSADLLGSLLSSNSVNADNIRILINNFYTDVRSIGMFAGIDDILNITHLPLIGIIPFSDKLHATQTYAYSTKDPDICAAFENVCLRMLGEEIKLLDFLPIRNRRKLLNN